MPSSGNAKILFYDKTQKLVATLEDIPDAVMLRYDAGSKKIYAGYGEGKLAVIDPKTREKVSDIELPGTAAGFVAEGKGSRIFVNIPSEGDVVEACNSTPNTKPSDARIRRTLLKTA